MNINKFLSNDSNFEKVKAIYELTQKNSSIYEKKEILQNNGLELDQDLMESLHQ